MQCLSRSWRSPVDLKPCSSPGRSDWPSHGLTHALRNARAYQRAEWKTSPSVRAIGTFLRLVATVCSLSVAAAAAEPTTCEVPDRLTKSGKALCVRAASILLPQPRLTPVQIANGPDFDPVHPDQSRFAYFTDADAISCY